LLVLLGRPTRGGLRKKEHGGELFKKMGSIEGGAAILKEGNRLYRKGQGELGGKSSQARNAGKKKHASPNEEDRRGNLRRSKSKNESKDFI